MVLLHRCSKCARLAGTGAVLRHDLFDRVDGGPGVEAGMVYSRAEGLAEGGKDCSSAQISMTPYDLAGSKSAAVTAARRPGSAQNQGHAGDIRGARSP